MSIVKRIPGSPSNGGSNGRNIGVGLKGVQREGENMGEN